MTNGILRWMHRKTANSRAVHFLPHHYFWAQLFPFLLSSVRIFACYLVELIKIGMTPSVRLSTHVHATQSQGLAAIWLPLWKEQFGQSTPPWNTRPWCYKNLQLTSRFCGGFAWCLVDGVAERGVRRLRACGSRSSTVACEAGQLDSYGQSWAWGHCLGTLTGLGTLAWPRGSGTPRLGGAGLAPRQRALPVQRSSQRSRRSRQPQPGHAGALVFSISECVMLCWSN